MARRSLVADFTVEDDPTITFADADDCSVCTTTNVGYRGPDGSAYCREHFKQEYPDLVEKVGS